MQCSSQGYWKWEYEDSKRGGVSSDNSYTQFAKRQYHKVRRKFDKEVIENQLQEICEDAYCEYNPFRYL